MVMPEKNTLACPALLLTAPASGQGKTTVTAALARLYKRRGKRVQVFKTGPDYLDPQILEQACARPVEQLDLWMAGEAYCRRRLYEAAQDADLILIEGAMGMFDGEPSSADLAARFGIPVVLVMNVKGMAQTTAAVAAGLAHFRKDIAVAGIIANACGSAHHTRLIEDALAPELPLLAALPREAAVALPERHLGLVQAAEIGAELDVMIDNAADRIAASECRSDYLLGLPAPVKFAPVAESPARQCGIEESLRGVRIGIARDDAFSFIYAANLQLLTSMGAQYQFFSPLRDRALPPVDALWLPGGYPELHAAVLAQNTSLRDEIVRFYREGKPILAECGGFLYCLDSLGDLQGREFTLLGLLPGRGAMRGKRGCQGMQTAPLPEGEVRGHSHHRSRAQVAVEPLAFARRQRHAAAGEAIYRRRGLTAGYLHLFFPSNPGAIAALFSGRGG